MLMAFAKCSGLCNGLTNTAHPSRSRSVQAAAYVMASSGASVRADPRTCSCVHALEKPSSSARLKCARNAAGSNPSSLTYWGIDIAKRIAERSHNRGSMSAGRLGSVRTTVPESAGIRVGCTLETEGNTKTRVGRTVATVRVGHAAQLSPP